MKTPVPRSVAEIDWTTWKPTDEATLVFIQRGDEVLLIHKKRGLGAGKINGPGGRMEKGETPPECAVREVREEVCVTPRGLRSGGENRFQFVDGYGIHVFVYTASSFDGEPQETEEAKPFWAPASDLPFDEMWEDDRLWLPLTLSGISFSGRFIFDGDKMLDQEILMVEASTWADSSSPLPENLL